MLNIHKTSLNHCPLPIRPCMPTITGKCKSLKTQMERELPKLSRFRKPIPLQVWDPGSGQPKANEIAIQPTLTNLHNKKGIELKQE